MRSWLDLTVNGIHYRAEVDGHRSLASVLRDDLGLTGTKIGCNDSECGACTVLIDDLPVNSCSYLAHQAGGRSVLTVEGLQQDGHLNKLQQAFLDAGGVQCGFCTPGMLISATALLERIDQPTETQVRTALSGNLCRCTGYGKIVQAVLAAGRMSSDDELEPST
jgi:aerobic-type carbon monoxide dehydrogenase small subunit (CoxS/CutS family)